MSIRIHELAKKLSMDNKDLMALLKERLAGRLDFAKAGALVKQRLAK